MSQTIETAVKYAIDIANNPKVGYDQVHRYLNPDVDCSSLVILSFEHAGLPVREHGRHSRAICARLSWSAVLSLLSTIEA